jgi:hypothetical protein
MPVFVKSARAKVHRGVDLISDALPFGRLSYGEPNAVSDADILRADATPASLNAAFTAITTANLSKD